MQQQMMVLAYLECVQNFMQLGGCDSFKFLTFNSDVICPRLDNSQTHIKQTMAEFAEHIKTGPNNTKQRIHAAS
jgi:hypothetical protein